MDQDICSDQTASLNATVTLGTASPATAYTGMWTGGTGSFDNASSPTAVYTPGAGELGAVTLTYTSTDPAGPCPSVFDDVVITVFEEVETDAGTNQTICITETATLSATITGGITTGTWSGGAGTFSSTTDLNAVYTPAASEENTTVILTLTTDDPTGPCPLLTDVVSITINPLPVVEAGPDQEICSDGTATMAGSVVLGVNAPATAYGGTWTTSGDGSFDNATAMAAVYTPGPTDAGPITLTLTSDDPAGPCPAINDQMVVYVVTKPDPPANPPVDALCEDLATYPTIDPGTGVYNFYRDGVLIAGVGDHVGSYTITAVDDETTITVTEIVTGPSGTECESLASVGAAIEILDPITYTTSTACSNDGSNTFTVSLTPDRGADAADDDIEIVTTGAVSILPSNIVPSGTAVTITYPLGAPWSISVQNATLGDPDLCPVPDSGDQVVCCPFGDADGPLQNLCDGELPDLTVAFAFSGGIMDMNGQLNTTDPGSGQDQGGDGVVWFPVSYGDPDPDPMVDPQYTDASLTVADPCAQAGYRMYAFLQCDKDGDLSSFDPVATPGPYDDEWIEVGAIEAVVFPEVSASINLPDLPVECRVEVIPSCMDFEVEATYEDEAFGTMVSVSLDGAPTVENTGTSYIFDTDAIFAPAASIGEVSFIVTNPAAPADMGSACITYDAGSQDYKCCIAEAGFPTASPICPDVYDTDGALVSEGEPMTVTVTGYEDFDLYSTYLIITDDAGMILEVIDLSDDATWPTTFSSVPAASPTNQSPTPSVPIGINTAMSFEFAYSHWTLPPYDLMPSDGPCEEGNPGMNLRFYSYNDFDFKQPSPLPQAMNGATMVPDLQNAGNTFTSDIALVGTDDEICFDLSVADEQSVPSPVTYIGLGPNTTEGSTGGFSPFYYNTHEITICGGSGPYDYDWEETGYVRHSITGEGQIRIIYADDADWSVTVTDQNGCASGLLVFSNNDLNGDGSENILLDIMSYDVEGNNPFTPAHEGTVSVVVTGGDSDCGDYTYDWTGPSTWDGTGNGTADISNCPSGWYSLTVTDCAGQTTNGWYWVNNVIPGTRSKMDETAMMVTPNPANHIAIVNISTADDARMNLSLYDMAGRFISTLHNGELSAGTTATVEIRTDALPAGAYLLKLNTDDQTTKTERLIITH